MSRYKDHTDQALLRLLQAGDELAFETIYRRYAEELNRFAFRKTRGRAEGEEIVQEIFVWLWSNRQNLEKITHLKTYLFQAAKNRILNYFRAEKVRDGYALDFAKFEADRDNSGEEEMNLSALTEVIEKSLGDFPERCQTAFRLSRMQNMPISGIAEQMAISHRTVENYISQALKHLRKKIESHP